MKATLLLENFPRQCELLRHRHCVRAGRSPRYFLKLFVSRIRKERTMHKEITRRFMFVLPLMALLFLASAAAFGQSTATLQGTVTDQKDAVVPNATVIVRNQSTSIERTVQTDSTGSYQIAALPPGPYTVEVQAQGF